MQFGVTLQQTPSLPAMSPSHTPRIKVVLTADATTDADRLSVSFTTSLILAATSQYTWGGRQTEQHRCCLHPDAMLCLPRPRCPSRALSLAALHSGLLQSPARKPCRDHSFSSRQPGSPAATTTSAVASPEVLPRPQLQQSPARKPTATTPPAAAVRRQHTPLLPARCRQPVS